MLRVLRKVVIKLMVSRGSKHLKNKTKCMIKIIQSKLLFKTCQIKRTETYNNKRKENCLNRLKETVAMLKVLFTLYTQFPIS